MISSVILCVITSIVAYYSYLKKREAQQLIAHTYLVIEQSLLVLTSFKDAETNQRGYFVTGDTVLLNMYYTTIRDMKEKVSKLRSLTLANPTQTTLIDSSISPYIDQRAREINETIQKHEREYDHAKSYISSRQARANFENLIDILEERERAMLKVHYEDLATMTSFNEWLIYSSLLLIGSTSVLAILTIRRVQNMNIQLFNALEQAKALLNTGLPSRPASFSKRTKN